MIYTIEFMTPLFQLLENCKDTPQQIDRHPEGNVFIHSLQVMEWAMRETEDTDLILAAMLHDVGKIHRVTGHDYLGAKMLEPYCSVKTVWLVEHHMRFWNWVEGEMKQLGKCLYLANHSWLPELSMLGRWDKMGRVQRKEVKYDTEKIMNTLNKYSMRKFKNE